MHSLPHISVLPGETMEQLQPRSGGIYCDGTLGAGGHTWQLLAASAPDGRVVGVDRDQLAQRTAKERLGADADRVDFVHGSFEDMDKHLAGLGIEKVDGILLDLGVSSMQLDRRERGFSFGKEGPVDMRMDPSQGETALELIERLPEAELARVVWEYGEERLSRRIAKRLKNDAADNKLTSTLVLADSVSACIPAKLKHKSRIHPATRTFQALRIAVNRELEQLERFLEIFVDLLAPGGRCAIISFHSLEDRMVKRCFRELAKTSNLPPDLARKAGERVHPICLPITRKPIIATEEEIQNNARSRSAKLRACKKVSQ
ncbi:MAG: 16S rRNA (cytosine(1402)-N(4))-methyltransferase RsmH [Myxococcales bacterium]|nr:16S rRNA (cytosine(1402)-N(4))-methyltransferase RsmH [Myxococcales bacterium]